jgi:hypothetical protein
LRAIVPVESRLFVKASLLWLCAAFALGAILLIMKAVGVMPHYNFSNVHAHMGFVGWLVNLVMGIALWFLPVNRERFPENRGRYPAGVVRVIFAALNIGLVLRVVFEPLAEHGQAPLYTAMLVTSAMLQLAAVILFAAIAWARVRQV